MTRQPQDGAAGQTLSLFAKCPLHGCGNLVDDPRWPCGECEAALAGYIRPAGREVTAEQAAAELAERDRAVAAVYAERRAMIPLASPAGDPADPAGDPAAPRPGPPLPAGIRRAAEQDLGLAYKPNQLCWVCEERHPCRRDPDHPGRWICRACEATT